jgi:hypothetical protein
LLLYAALTNFHRRWWINDEWKQLKT